MTASTITFRPVGEADLPLLADWFARPHVREWWHDGPRDTESCRQKFLPTRRDEPTINYYLAFEIDAPIGFIQSYVAAACGDGWWEDVTDPGIVGIDQFLADGTMLGQGLGTRMITTFVRRLLADPNVTRVQTDPDPRNARAIRCYEKAGFRAVGDIVTPDGEARLMVIDKA